MVCDTDTMDITYDVTGAAISTSAGIQTIPMLCEEVADTDSIVGGFEWEQERVGWS